MDCSNSWEVPVDDEVKTVVVSNLSVPVSEIEIRRYFGVCGGIKHVEISSENQDTAYIIFKKFAGVLPALNYSGRVSTQLCEETPTGYKPFLVEVKTVVSNLSVPVSEIEIRRYFGMCGGIKHVAISSENQNTAYIIFKKFAGVLPALNCSGRVSTQLCEETPTGYKPFLVELKTVKDISGAESAVRRGESVRSMYNEACTRYSLLRKHYIDYQSKCGKACEKEDWGICKWMMVESMANGWKTLEGNSLGNSRAFGTAPGLAFDA